MKTKTIYDYTIIVKRVEGGFWQAQLQELPGVITIALYWDSLQSQLEDALVEYQAAEEEEVESQP